MKVMTRQEAAKRANTYTRWASKAKEEWDMHIATFWEKQREQLIVTHQLQIRTFTLAGFPIAERYV